MSWKYERSCLNISRTCQPVIHSAQELMVKLCPFPMNSGWLPGMGNCKFLILAHWSFFCLLVSTFKLAEQATDWLPNVGCILIWLNHISTSYSVGLSFPSPTSLVHYSCKFNAVESVTFSTIIIYPSFAESPDPYLFHCIDSFHCGHCHSHGVWSGSLQSSLHSNGDSWVAVVAEHYNISLITVNELSGRSTRKVVMVQGNNVKVIAKLLQGMCVCNKCYIEVVACQY